MGAGEDQASHNITCSPSDPDFTQGTKAATQCTYPGGMEG